MEICNTSHYTQYNNLAANSSQWLAVRNLVNISHQNSSNSVYILSQHCHEPEMISFAEWMVQAYYKEVPSLTGCTPTLRPKSLHMSYWAKLCITFIFATVGAFGAIGNILTFYVIYTNKSLQTHTNYFLASLAISDLMLLIVGVPFDIIHSWMPSEPPPIPFYCEFTSTTISFFTFVSIVTIVCLTFERYTAICKPFSRLTLSKQRVRQVICASWIAAFIPSLYLGMQFKQVIEDICGFNRDLGIGLGHCDYVTSPDMLFAYPFELAMLVTFIVPLVLIIFCYARILHELNKSSMARGLTSRIPLESKKSDATQRGSVRDSLREKLSGTNRNSTHQISLRTHDRNQLQRSQQAHRMIIRMLVTVTVTFFVCYLPYHIERLIAQYTKQQCKNSILCVLLYSITGLLQYVSATLNPIFYNLMSDRFRDAFKHTFHRIFTRKKPFNAGETRLPSRAPMKVADRRGTRYTDVFSTEVPPLL